MSSEDHHAFIGFGTTAVHAGQNPEKWDSNQVCKERTKDFLGVEGLG